MSMAERIRGKLQAAFAPERLVVTDYCARHRAAWPVRSAGGNEDPSHGLKNLPGVWPKTRLKVAMNALWLWKPRSYATVVTLRPSAR